MTLTKTMARIRQWTFPREFRIEADAGAGVAEVLVTAVRGALAEADEARAKARAAESKIGAAAAAVSAAAGKPGAGIDAAFAISICNDVFRIRRNARQLSEERGESKETRSIQRAMEDVDALLAERGIKYTDPTGKDFDERSEDFEPMGQPQEVPGLDRKVIAACERPVVLLNGRLIQRAKGVVQRPPQASA